MPSSSVDLVRRRLVVAESVTEVNGRLVWGAPKTHARRTVPLPRFLVSDLDPLVTGKEPDDLVFIAPRGGVLRGRNFRRNTFDPAVRLVGRAASTLTSCGTPPPRSRSPPVPTSRSSSRCSATRPRR
jgi:hypothetical protein